MRTIKPTAFAASALAALALGTAALPAAAAPAAGEASAVSAAAATREYEGTITSINRSARTFRLRDSERGTVTIRITRNTRFERVTFASLRSGQTNIEAVVRRSNGRWVALEVERSGGGGDHGGDDDSGSDDD